MRVRLEASSLNHADLWASHGQPKIARHFPFVLGVDGAGTIDAVGAGVDEALIGRDVVLNPVLSCGICARCVAGERMLCRKFQMVGEHVDGTHADAICVPAVCAVDRPAELTAEEAAAGATVFATAYRLLFTRARLLPGERVLIHGIGGGLATAALQLAKVAGAQCTVTSSDDTKLERARALGADHTVNYRSGDVIREVRAAMGAADVVVDSVGGGGLGCELPAAGAGRAARERRRHRRRSWIGADRPPVLAPARDHRNDDGDGRGVPARSRPDGRRPVSARSIDRMVPLAGVPEALLALERGEQFGKIVVSRA